MKRSKKPLTFTAIAAGIGALSMAVEGCVYGPPPQETNVYGPPPETSITEETDDTKETMPGTKPGETSEEVCVYGPPPDETLDGPEEDVYGPPPDFSDYDEPETVVYGPPSTSES